MGRPDSTMEQARTIGSLRRASRWTGLFLVAWATLLLLACQGARESGPAIPPGTPRGVVLISIDTLRADHLSAYGYEKPTSPFMDEVAAAGVLFENAISSAPWTLPAHASILTGLDPSTHRAVDGSEGIAVDVTMAAEMFRDAGYATGGFVASWFVSRRYGFDRGFDHFDDFQRTIKNNTKEKIIATPVIDAAGSWLREHGEDPFFLFVHLYDAHFNYDPPAEHAALFDTGYTGPREHYRKYSYYPDHPLPPDLLAQEVALYDAEIHFVDAELRRLYGVLEEMGLADDVLILITADHGEEFFERGSWGHAHTLYEEVIRVPLIVKGPGIEGSRRWPGQVRQVDILPTLMDAFFLAGPARLPGISLWPLLREGRDRQERDGTQAPAGPRPAFMETSRFGSNVIGVRRDGWKAILNLVDGQEHLFDLSQDPGEEHNLAAAQPERMREMREEVMLTATILVPDRWLLRWFADSDAPLEGRVTTTGDLSRARLRSGGGHIAMDDDGGGLSYRLEPGSVLEMAVIPVDAALTVEPPTSGGRQVAIALGREGATAPRGRVEANTHQAALLTGIPTPQAPAVAFWLEQSRGGGATVHLSEDEIRRLESLGYVMR
ncbi:MAG: sulfatase [Acidobacteria bacterium]|nr:sulfatase [Acidobacteriota bacterium]